jgi:hypothetical protein
VFTNLTDVYCEPPSLLVVRLAEGEGGGGMTPSGNLQYCHFQCPYGFVCATLGTECVCQPFSRITIQDAKQITPSITTTPDIGDILLPKLVLSFRYCNDPFYDNMLSDTSLPDQIGKL